MFKSNSGIIIADSEEQKDKDNNYKLKSNNKNIDLSEIKKNNNEIMNSMDLKKLDTVEMNFQQDFKDDKDSDNIYILREPFDAKKSTKQEEEKNNLINNNINNNLNLNNNEKNKKINIDLNLNLNDIDKNKSKKINLKLSHLQINNKQEPINNQKKKKNYSVNKKSNTNKGYLNYEGDDWKNKKFDNYKYHNMTPNYRKKKNMNILLLLKKL